MIKGVTKFKCDECGHKFDALAIEWQATAFTAPSRCPQCGSMHTYPVGGLSGLFGLSKPNPFYKEIWRQYDDNK